MGRIRTSHERIINDIYVGAAGLLVHSITYVVCTKYIIFVRYLGRPVAWRKKYTHLDLILHILRKPFFDNVRW